jgi:hypothetical protein
MQMSNNMDLKAIEQKTYLSYHQDGLADIAAGFLVGVFGLGMALNSGTLFTITWLPIALIFPLKRIITYPRIGYIKFAPVRRRKLSKGIMALNIAGVIFAGLGLIAFLGVSGELADLKPLFDRYSTLLVGAIMACAIILAALVFQIKRFYAYAIIEFGAWLLSHMLQIDPGFPVAIAGGIVFLIGVAFLIRFLTENPRLPA